jgi:ABC-type phosphate/phosphonate transport system substrate-binding protein
MIASLPMYLSHTEAVDALWVHLASSMLARGLAHVPSKLTWPRDLRTHWQNPDLLLSQTCGYPIVSYLADSVHVLGAFCYSAPGCEGISYSSFLVARANDPGSELSDFRSRRVGYNSPDSQSGFNCLRALVAPLARDGKFFLQAVATGGHAASVNAVIGDTIDIAAIDCVTFAGLTAADPGIAAKLKIVGRTALAPGLPLITHRSASPEDIALLRAAICDVIDDPQAAPLLARLMIDGFKPMTAADYGVIAGLERAAIAAGYPALT